MWSLKMRQKSIINPAIEISCHNTKHIRRFRKVILFTCKWKTKLTYKLYTNSIRYLIYFRAQSAIEELTKFSSNDSKNLSKIKMDLISRNSKDTSPTTKCNLLKTKKKAFAAAINLDVLSTNYDYGRYFFVNVLISSVFDQIGLAFNVQIRSMLLTVLKRLYTCSVFDTFFVNS